MLRKSTIVKQVTWEDALFLWECLRAAGNFQTHVCPTFSQSMVALSYIKSNYPNSSWYIIWGVTPRVGKHRIGFVQFEALTQPNVYEVTAYINPRKKGYGTNLWKQIVAIGRSLGAHRLEFSVADFNKQTRYAVERRTNAVFEGKQISAIFHKGRWYDNYLYGYIYTE